jgi:hypothetical protein
MTEDIKIVSQWHGWTREPEPYTGRALHIGPLPNRKSICLYTMDYRNGATMYVHAYFRSMEEARRALETLDHLMEGGRGT